LREIQRRRPADIIRQQIVKLGVKLRVGSGLFIFDCQLVERPRQRFRHVSSAEGAESPGGIGYLAARRGFRGGHRFDSEWTAPEGQGWQQVASARRDVARRSIVVRNFSSAPAGRTYHTS